MKAKLCLVFLSVLVLSGSAQAQFLRSIKNKVQNKVADKVAEKLADKIADEITRRAYRSIDKAFEDAAKEQYADSTGSREYDGEAYSRFLKSFSGAAEKLPASYAFDIVNHMEVEDFDGTANTMKMLFADKAAYFGMETEENGKISTMVYDFDREIMSLFMEENGKKTVQVLPALTAQTFSYAADRVEEEKFTFEKTGRTKTFCGFHCEEYKVESEKYLTFAFIAPEFPVTWTETFGQVIEKFAPYASSKNAELAEGMALYSETQLKEEPQKKSLSEVVRVDQAGFILDAAQYEKNQ